MYSPAHEMKMWSVIHLLLFIMYTCMYYRQQELNRKEAQLAGQHSMLNRHHDEIQDIEYKNLAAIHKLRDEQLRKQHSTELQNQQEYTDRQQKELRKRHISQTKLLPRSINVRKMSARLPNTLSKHNWCVKSIYISSKRFVLNNKSVLKGIALWIWADIQQSLSVATVFTPITLLVLMYIALCYQGSVHVDGTQMYVCCLDKPSCVHLYRDVLLSHTNPCQNRGKKNK